MTEPSDDSEIIALTVGKPYPLNMPVTEGAVTELFMDGLSMVLIYLPNITEREVKSFGKPISVGMYWDKRRTYFLWQFGTGKNKMVFEGIYEPALVPEHLLKMPQLSYDTSRLVITFHVVDSSSKIIKVLRAVTLPPNISNELIELTHHQLHAPELITVPADVQQLRGIQPSQAIEFVKMFEMGV